MARPLRLIGDIHGKTYEYLGICAQAEADGENTLQLGDFGFVGSYQHVLYHKLNPKIHRMFKGNHDDYGSMVGQNFPYDIGNFGEVPDYPHLFFVRGGFSIDRQYRTEGKNWFPEEELSIRQLGEAIEVYKKLKPQILLSHEPPYEFGRLIGNPDMLKSFGFDPETFKTRTALALQEMIDAHPPELVVCGHMHLDREMKIGQTKFVCLGELSTYVINHE